MAKYLKDVLDKNSTTKKTNDLGGYKPKAGDEEKFAKKHEIEVHDRTPAEEHQFKGGTKEASFPKQSEGVYESKKAENVSCNQTPAGTKCPMHEMADCPAVRNIKELSKDTLGNYIKSASADVGHKKADAAYSRMSGLDKQADKNTDKARKRLGGIYTAVNKLSKEEVEQVVELSTDTYHSAAHKAAKKAMGDVQGRSGPIFKKYAGMANKFRAKGMEQEKKEKAVKEAYDDNSSNVSDWSDKKLKWHKEKQSSSSAKAHSELVRRSKTGQAAKTVKEETIDEGIQTKKREDLHGKDSRLHHKELKASGYVSKGSDANYKNSSGTEHSYYHPKSNTMHAFRAKGGKINHAYEWTPNISYAKAHGADVHEETVEEGAKVDRMVAHVKSSEKAAGKSDKKAENIAWATANKRGMLDNKNKKTNEANAVEPLLQGDKPSGHSNEAAEMAKAELKALANKALHLVMQMPESMHVEPWCQAKIAQAKSMINDVHDYMIYGNHEEEDEQADSQMQITPAASPGNTLVNPAGDPDRGRIV